MKLPVGVNNFKELIEEKFDFVDKSNFIKEIMDDSAKIILITRPRRFGKSLNMSMLYFFLTQRQANKPNLFENLEISKDVEFCREHQNKHPVILISFKDIKEISYKKVIAKVGILIGALYGQHMYLLEGTLLHEHEKDLFRKILKTEATEEQLENSLKALSEYLNGYFSRPPIVLIDEYDTPIQEAYVRGYYAELIPFMRSLLGQVLKDNDNADNVNIKKAIITGITRVAQESIFSGLNHFEVYTLLRQNYGQYFGFTEPEVIKLIDQTGVNISLQAIKEWYNGYQVGKYTLYNPWSIIKCLKDDGKLEPYWLYTSSNELISTLLMKSDYTVKQRFEELLQGKVIDQALMVNLVFADLEDREEALWNLLLSAGYLKVLSSELVENRLIAKLAIPNKEVSLEYKNIIEGWFNKAGGLKKYDKFVKSVVEGDIKGLKEYIAEYIMNSGSYFDFNRNASEQTFHLFMLGLISGLMKYYIIQSNAESGFGRCDIVLIPKDHSKQAILFEFKASKTVKLLLDKAKEALAQIKDKNYTEILRQHEIKSVLAIGIAFSGKELSLVHENIGLL